MNVLVIAVNATAALAQTVRNHQSAQCHIQRIPAINAEDAPGSTTVSTAVHDHAAAAVNREIGVDQDLTGRERDRIHGGRKGNRVAFHRQVRHRQAQRTNSVIVPVRHHQRRGDFRPTEIDAEIALR